MAEPSSAKRFSRKTAFMGEVRRGRHIVQFAMDISPNVPGMLATLSELLAKHYVNVLSGFHDPPHWSFFADVTECGCNLDQLKSELSSVVGATKIETVSSPVGVLVDSLHFPLVWGEHRALMIRARTMSIMLNHIKEMLGQESPVAKVMLYQLGEAARKAMYTATKALFGDDVKKDWLIECLLNVYSAEGCGIFQASRVNFEDCTATVSVLNNFECEFFEGVGPKSMSQFVRGHLAGVFSDFFGKRVTASVSECLSSGSQHCEFNILPL